MLDTSARSLINPTSEAVERLRASLFSVRQEMLQPILTPAPSVWAQQNIVLGPETSPGGWGPLRLYKFSAQMMDQLALEEFKRAALMKSAQIGYTLDLAILMAWWLSQTTDRVLFFGETEDKIKLFVRSYLDPILYTTEETRALLPITDQMEYKKRSITGATAEIVTAINDENFRSINGSPVLADELDSKYWLQGGSEAGDKIDRLIGRIQSVDGNKLIMGSTPRNEASSIIRKHYEAGDRRKFHVPCPECGEPQALIFGGRDHEHGLRFDDKYGGKAYYRCVRGCDFTDGGEELEVKKHLLDAGEWLPTAPPAEEGLISFHTSALYSWFKASRWDELRKMWRAAQHAALHEADTSRLKVFVNERLGETWKTKDESTKKGAEPGDLQKRNMISYGSAQVPAGVRVLTAFVDVQSGKGDAGGHFEVSVWGWGEAERGWLIAHYILDQHSIVDPGAWFALEDLLKRGYRGENRKLYAIQATAIDYGGHYGQAVSDFAARNSDWRIWATKGRGRGADQRRAPWPKDPSKTKHGGLVYEVCTWRVKDIMYQRLTFEPPAPFSLSFPRESLEGSTPVDPVFFQRLTREVPRMVKGTIRWDNQPSDQEPWDCLVGAYAALHGLMSIPTLGIKELVAAPKPAKKLGKPPAPGVQVTDGEKSTPALAIRGKAKPTFGMGSGARRGGLLRL